MASLVKYTKHFRKNNTNFTQNPSRKLRGDELFPTHFIKPVLF